MLPSSLIMMSLNNDFRQVTGTLDIESTLRFEVRGIGIPPRPIVIEQINEAMQAAEPDFKRLANAISSDVSLSASLIKVVNSPYYGFSKKVRSIQEALMVLGVNVIARTVAGLALQKAFAHLAGMERYWDMSACTARLSGWLAHRLGKSRGINPDEAYTFGLFHDCGIPWLMTQFPEYVDVLKRANAEQASLFTDVEDQALGINHAVAGAAMAKEWLFADEYLFAIRFHHEPTILDGVGHNTMPDISRRLIAITQMAEYLVEERIGLGKTSEWPKLGYAALRLLEMDENDLDTLFDDSVAIISGESFV